MLDEERHYLAKLLLQAGVLEQTVGKKVVAGNLGCLEGIDKLAAHGIDTEETVEILQVGAADESWRLHVGGTEFAPYDGGLSAVHHRQQVFRHCVHRRLVGQHEGVLVAVAERPVLEQRQQELTAPYVLQHILYHGMLEEEGQEPVAYAAEERETLHLLEAAEVDVRPLLLHVQHAVHALLKLLHALLGQFGV